MSRRDTTTDADPSPDHRAPVVRADDGDGRHKCGRCSHRVAALYRLETEPDDQAVCGSCLTQWLVAVGGEAVVPEGRVLAAD